MLDKEFQQLDVLANQARYTPGHFKLYNKTIISFPDSNSFVFTYRELFKKEIYKFECKTDRPLIIDCGANIGLSILYFKKLFPYSNIIAFEPEIKIHSYLQTNIAAFALKDVEIHNKALWKEDGVINFSNEGADASRINALSSDTGFINSYQVDCVRLSSYLNRKVDFLKLDIEGAEVEVIKEIEPCIGNVDNIFIEYHSFDNRKQELDVLLSILTRNGFHYYIDSPVMGANSPFIKKESWLAFDCFLNIYAKKTVE